LAEEVKTWSFDIHKIAAAELPALCFGVIMQHPAVTRVLPQLSLHRLWRFVEVVASRYRDNPFHSFRHAVDVTLGISCLLRWLQEAQPTLLSDLQVVAALVAAMVHDTDHPGVMNNFLVATRHPLAVLYNHQSVLENHHIATAMALTSRPELDWISPLPAAEQAELRKVMIELVLATDPTTHMPFMKRFMEDVAAQTVTPMQAMAAMLKGADISNPTRPITVYAVWVEGIMKEFFAQGDAERTLGLPISMNCDRESVNVNKCQVGFITFLVSPIWKGIAQLLPAQGPQLLAELGTNLAHYQALAA
jgi:cAMP-specific phosphodiesterase 4